MVYKTYPHSIFYASIFAKRLHSPILKPLNNCIFSCFQEVLHWDQFKFASFVKRYLWWIHSHQKLFSDQKDSSVGAARLCQVTRISWFSADGTWRTSQNTELMMGQMTALSCPWLLSLLDLWEFKVKENTTEDILPQYIYKVNQWMKWNQQRFRL